MKIDILTLFPNMFDGVFQESIIKKAIDDGKVEINLINFRDYTLDPHNKVDDTPYGGGAYVVIMRALMKEFVVFVIWKYR